MDSDNQQEISSDQQSAQETPDSSVSQQTSAAQPQHTSTEEGVELEGGAEGLSAPAAPAYNPNFKFKFLDKELEFDEFVRGAVKDQDTEKKLRTLYEKAHGLDFIKPKYQETRDKFQALQQEHNGLSESLKELSSYVQRNDFDSFFQALKIPEQAIVKFVVDKLNYQGLPAEQKQAYDRSRQVELRTYQQEREIEQLRSSYQQAAAQARTVQLDSTLNRVDIKSQADAFDAQVGRPGAFREEVIKRGKLAFYTSGQDLSPEQAIQEALSVVGPFLQSRSQAQTQPPSSPAPQAQGSEPAKAPPTLPHVIGRPTSPTQKSVGSVDDIRQRYKELSGS